MNYQPQTPNLKSHDMINPPQNQVETNEESFSLLRPFSGGNEQASDKAKAKLSVEEQEFMKQIPERRKKHNFKKWGVQSMMEIPPLSKRKSNSMEEIEDEQEMKMEEIKEEMVHKKEENDKGDESSGDSNNESDDRGSESSGDSNNESDDNDSDDNDSDDNDSDSILDSIAKLSDNNEELLLQYMKENQEEKLHSDVSEVFEWSNHENQESNIQAIEKDNEEKLDLNENEVFGSWDGNNEDYLLQCIEEIMNGKPDLNTNRFIKDSNGNNKCSVLQDIEANMNAEFNLNANESFQLCESLSIVSFEQQQNSAQQGVGNHTGVPRSAFVENRLRKGQYEV